MNSEEMKIEWDGKGLPPVGCECEVKAEDFEDWTRINVVYVHNGEIAAVVKSDNSYFNDRLEKFSNGYNGAKFRPILTEAERRREDRIKSLNAFIGGYMKSTSGDYSKLGEALFEWLAVLDKANETGS